MPLHDAVGINCENGKLLNVKAQMLSTWAKGYMLMTMCVCVCVCVCVLSD